MMKKIVVKIDDTVVINEKTDLDLSAPFKALSWVIAQLAPRETELFGGKVYEYGIREFAQNGSNFSTDAEDVRDISAIAKSSNSAVIGITKTTANDTVKIHTNDGNIVDTGIRVHIHGYTSGLVVSTGKKGYDILGGVKDLYLEKFTRTSMKSCAIGYAKVFDSWKQLKKYLQQHEDEMTFIAGRNPITFSAITIGDGVKEDGLAQAEVNEILRSINGMPKDLEDHSDLPSEATPETMKDEAIHRMKLLNLYDKIIAEYKQHGKIYMSENFGTLYNPDDTALQAIQEAVYDNLKPYHVIKTRLMGRDVYDVLYVSENIDDWQYERPNKEGYIASWCWMSDFQCSESGDIKVASIGGGLRRIG